MVQRIAHKFAVLAFLSAAIFGRIGHADPQLQAVDVGEGGSVLLEPTSPFLLYMGALHSFGLFREADDTQTPYRHASIGKIDIDPVKLGQCMTVAAVHSGQHLSFSKSEANCFDAATGEEVRGKRCDSRRGDLLGYLVFGGEIKTAETLGSGKLALGSGHEHELTSWILNQPENSVDPVSLFAKSLELTKENIWTALLTVHEALRPAARWYDKKRYGGSWTASEAKNLFNRFIDIRGDLWEACPGKLHGDHEGTWFRIWGAMLFQASFYSAEQMTAMTGLGYCRYAAGKDDRLNDKMADIFSALAFYADERIEKSTEVDLGKFRVDLAAARAAKYMKLSMETYRTLTTHPVSNPKLTLPTMAECKARIYLKRYSATWDDVPFAKPLDKKQCHKIK